jgi:hypothetical protein
MADPSPAHPPAAVSRCRAVCDDSSPADAEPLERRLSLTAGHLGGKQLGRLLARLTGPSLGAAAVVLGLPVLGGSVLGLFAISRAAIGTRERYE